MVIALVQSGSWMAVQDHVKREKEVMAECQFPFVVALKAGFQDATHLYLLMETVMGGEFFNYLQVTYPALPRCFVHRILKTHKLRSTGKQQNALVLFIDATRPATAVVPTGQNARSQGFSQGPPTCFLQPCCCSEYVLCCPRR